MKKDTGDYSQIVTLDRVLKLIEIDDLLKVEFNIDGQGYVIGVKPTELNAAGKVIRKHYYINDSTYDNFDNFSSVLRQMLPGFSLTAKDIIVYGSARNSEFWKTFDYVPLEKEACGSNCVKMYSFKLLGRNASFLFGFAFLMVSILAIFALCYNKLQESFYIFHLFTMAAVAFIVFDLKVIRFISTIKKQERLNNANFNNKGGRKLCFLVYLTNEWLINAGDFALLRKNILDIQDKEVSGSYQYYKVILTTTIGKFTLTLKRQEDVLALKSWVQGLEPN